MPFVLRSLALAASLVVAATSPSPAASRVTRTFLANLIPNVDFLDRSSRFALTSSKNARLRAFARGEAREQTSVADALYDWTQADAHPLIASAAAPVPPATSPMPAKDLDNTPTGSTKPAWPALAKPDPAVDDRLPRSQEDLDSLEGLTGKAFDAEYKDKQADALQQVETDYRDYLAKGDDPALQALAKRELPKITKRRAALAKL